MDNQQAAYLDIFEAFEKRRIELAYPTQTVLVDSQVTPSLLRYGIGAV